MTWTDHSGLAFGLRYCCGPALHQWLRDLHFTTFGDGARLARLIPAGINRGPADAGRCLHAAELAGAIARAGYSSCPSASFFKKATYKQHPSKREPLVEPEERSYRPGPDLALLESIALSAWADFVAAGACGWPT